MGGNRLLGGRWSVLSQLGAEDRRTPCWCAGLQACQLALSTRTVWARCPNGDLARRYGVTDKNPAGDYWKKIPGNVTCFTGKCWTLRGSGLRSSPRVRGSRGRGQWGLHKRLLPQGSLSQEPRVTPEGGHPAPHGSEWPGRTGRGATHFRAGQLRHRLGVACPGPTARSATSRRGAGPTPPAPAAQAG